MWHIQARWKGHRALQNHKYVIRERMYLKTSMAFTHSAQVGRIMGSWEPSADKDGDSKKEESNGKVHDGEDSNTEKWELGSHNVVIENEQMANFIRYSQTFKVRDCLQMPLCSCFLDKK